MSKSFGRPEPAEETKADDTPQPVPVLHVGEVHAELRLTISPGTVRDLGSQLASMFASAAKQGFEAGMVAAMEELEGGSDDAGVEPEPRRRGTRLDLSDPGPAVDLHLSDKDIERLGRAR